MLTSFIRSLRVVPLVAAAMLAGAVHAGSIGRLGRKRWIAHAEPQDFGVGLEDDLDGAAFRQPRNAVQHRVLQQRLQHQSGPQRCPIESAMRTAKRLGELVAARPLGASRRAIKTSRSNWRSQVN